MKNTTISLSVKLDRLSRWLSRPMLAAALFLPGCFAQAEDEDECKIQAGGPGAMVCDVGGCQATYEGCGSENPTPRLEALVGPIAPEYGGCVPFPELGEWRCYWPEVRGVE